LEIVHRAAPCRNVPVTFTLALMSEASLDALAALLRHCEIVSQRMLEESGEFYPFGAFVAPDGRVAALGASSGSDHPDPKQHFEFLHGAITQMAREGRLIGYAIAANVNIPAEYSPQYPDGVRIQVETAGYSRFIYTPYRVLPFKSLRKFLVALPVIEYAEPIAVDVPPNIFAANDPG
jgi:hypothetical protein